MYQLKAQVLRASIDPGRQRAHPDSSVAHKPLRVGHWTHCSSQAVILARRASFSHMMSRLLFTRHHAHSLLVCRDFVHKQSESSSHEKAGQSALRFQLVSAMFSKPLIPVNRKGSQEIHPIRDSWGTFFCSEVHLGCERSDWLTKCMHTIV